MGLLNMLFGKPQKSMNVVSLNRDLQILNDCAKLLENTVVPEVFFSRYDLYMEKLSTLSDAQKARLINVKGDNLCRKYKEMNTETKRIDIINEFIDRMWCDTYQKAQKLKTEKEKQNCYAKFYGALAEYEKQMPEQCIKYYCSINVESNTPKPRNTIPADRIDEMQRIEASAKYRNAIYKKYYSEFPEKPYISQDRELNTEWIEQATLFPQQCIIPRSMMTRYEDGLLPGHIYMLHWIDKIHRKRIPAYFEYKYGIDFVKEKLFLENNGYLHDNTLTEKGAKVIKQHIEVIDNHSEKRY